MEIDRAQSHVFNFNVKGQRILIEISKEQMEDLIEQGILKERNGKYYNLVVTSRNRRGKRKKRYIPDSFKKYLN